MEALFENHYERTKEMFREYCGYMFFARPSMLILDVLLVLFTAAAILLGVTPGILLSPVIIAAAQIYMYFYTANTMVKRDAEVTSGGTIRVDAAATEDRLLFKASNGSEQELPYAKMKKIIQTKRLILIRSEANLCYILPKDTFTKGTPEAFLAFLKEKRA